MTSPDHYAEAERLLAEANRYSDRHLRRSEVDAG